MRVIARDGRVEKRGVFDFGGRCGGLTEASWGKLQNPAAGGVLCPVLGFPRWFGQCQGWGKFLPVVVVEGFADGLE